MLKEYEMVRLTREVTHRWSNHAGTYTTVETHVYPVGSRGCIVEVFKEPVGYLVEFFDPPDVASVMSAECEADDQ